MERRLNIILDLDSTIIYGEEFKKVNNLDDIKEKYKNVHTMDTSYYIIERYGLQDFLTFLYLLTSKDSFFSFQEMFKITGFSQIENLNKNK